MHSRHLRERYRSMSIKLKLTGGYFLDNRMSRTSPCANSELFQPSADTNTVALVGSRKYEQATAATGAMTSTRTMAAALEYEQISRRSLGFNRYACFAWPTNLSRHQVRTGNNMLDPVQPH